MTKREGESPPFFVSNFIKFLEIHENYENYNKAPINYKFIRVLLFLLVINKICTGYKQDMHRFIHRFPF